MPRLTAHDVAHASQTDHRILRNIEDDDQVLPSPLSAEVILFDKENTTMPEWEIERALALAVVHRLREAAFASPKDTEGVEQTLTAVTEIAPDDLASWIALGAARYLRQDFDRAHEAWQRALALQPANEQALDALVGYCQTRGQYQEGIGYLDRLIELDPWRSRDHFQRATWLSALGRWREALANAETALTLDPTDRTARRWIIKAAESAGDVQTSGRHAEILRRMSE